MSDKRSASAQSTAPSKKQHQDSCLPTATPADFRLFNLRTAQLESWPLQHHPPYLAASHTWSEGVFPTNTPFSQSFGGQGVNTIVQQRFPDIQYLWFDTLCIDQNDPTDKLQQIPLMGEIFSNATCVVVFISAQINATQTDVDWLAGKLEGAFAMCLDEAWTTEGDYWQNGEGRKLIQLGMEGLLRLASTSWATRIWTLQEYVLAQRVLWIGLDLSPIEVDNYAMSALPDICDTLAIKECLTKECRVLSSHFAAMASVRARNIDRTRVQELTGNRKATVPIDEVYGVMAVSGVVITPVANETKQTAWRRWCVQAVQAQHGRWILLPSTSRRDMAMTSCIFPPFYVRHKLSASSSLDYVSPLGPLQVRGSAVTVSARRIGTARVIRRLGSVHAPRHGMIHRDITIILFAEGDWWLALRLVWTFGGGRYSLQQARQVAQVLVQSYGCALKHVTSATEDQFVPITTSQVQQRIWNDFMALQQSQMLGLNECVGYLVRIDTGLPRLPILAVLNVGHQPPHGKLEVLDMNAKAPDGRSLLMIVLATSVDDRSGLVTCHKVGMTLPISDDFDRLWRLHPISRYRIGGDQCFGCSMHNRGEPVVDSIPGHLIHNRSLLQQLARHREWTTRRFMSYRTEGKHATSTKSRRLAWAVRRLGQRLRTLISGSMVMRV